MEAVPILASDSTGSLPLACDMLREPSSSSAAQYENDDKSDTLTQHFLSGELVRFHHAALRRKSIPGKGNGLVVSEAVPAGTLLLVGAAFVQGETRRDRLSKVLAQRKASAMNFQRMMSMAAVEGICSAECNESLFQQHRDVDRDEILRIMDILGTNDHGPAFWIEPAGANHSCDSNARFITDRKTLELSIKTTRPLEPGEEVTVSYLNKKMNRTSRRILLKKGWGFDCQCSKCEAEA